jgi:phosphatidylglycerophosphate synthase
VRMAQLAAERYSPRVLTDGERWTATELESLRRQGYRLSAWIAFVAHSLRRSAETRQARPALVRQARRWGALGGLAWIVACRGRHRQPGGHAATAAGLLWWLAAWRMLDWHLGMAEGGDGIPRPRLGRADAVTMARIWLVPLLPAIAGTPRRLAFVIALGGASDWLDGALARRDGRTRLGRDLDTFADLVFVQSATCAAYRSGRLGPMAAGAVAARHGVGVGLACGAVFVRARRPAIRARRAGALLRFGGLTLAAAGSERPGTALLIAGCVTPPIRTAPELSPA